MDIEELRKQISILEIDLQEDLVQINTVLADLRYYKCGLASITFPDIKQQLARFFGKYFLIKFVVTVEIVPNIRETVREVRIYTYTDFNKNHPILKYAPHLEPILFTKWAQSGELADYFNSPNCYVYVKYNARSYPRTSLEDLEQLAIDMQICRKYFDGLNINK